MAMGCSSSRVRYRLGAMLIVGCNSCGVQQQCCGFDGSVTNGVQRHRWAIPLGCHGCGAQHRHGAAARGVRSRRGRWLRGAAGLGASQRRAEPGGRRGGRSGDEGGIM